MPASSPRHTLKTLTSLSAVAALFFLPLAGHAQRKRIVADLEAADGERVTLRQNVAARARAAADLGAVPAETVLNAMTLRFSLTAAQQTTLTRLLIELQDPKSPRYHQWLTPEQFGAQFGLAPADLAAVSNWLTNKGFTVMGAARSGTFVTFTGTAAQVEHAFGTTLHRVGVDGEQHIANLTDPTLPSPLAAVVTGITGLNDFKLRPRIHSRTVTPEFTSATSGNHFIAPGDFFTIYDELPLLTNSIKGTGITIAVMGQTDISLADVAAFRAASGLPAAAPGVQLFGKDPGISKVDLDEAQLDVEWTGAVAQGANILYVNSTDVLGGSMTQAIDNNLAPILSISYGDCEAGYSASELALFNQLFQQANAQGITIIGPTGDSGATDCDYHATSAKQGLAVDFPASSPFVTAAGGTMFNEGSGNYFNTGNGPNSGSAISYIPEAVWNESSAGGLAGGGGGASTIFSKPVWQVGLGVPQDYSRDIPDISLNAASGHDGYLFCTQGSCVNGYRSATGNLAVVGGTSVSTPAFAGLLALVEQKIGSRVGNANPVIYGLANSVFASNVFHDVVTGNNSSNCTAGTPNCPGGGAIGFSAGPGYDLATGWGTLDALNLVTDWKLVTPAGAGSTVGTAGSTTTVTGAVSAASAGATLELSVTIASAAGTAPVPGGTVQLVVDGVASGAAITLAGGTASATVKTAGLSSGRHTVAAAYSGDTVYAASKGQFPIDVVTGSDFFLTPASTTVSVSSGSAAPGIVFTVAPVNGFTGSVNFSLSTTATALAVTPSFTVNPVIISGTAAGTTTLNLLAQATSLGTIPVQGAGLSSGPAKFAVLSTLSLAGLLCFGFGFGTTRRRVTGLLGVVVLCAVGSMSGCGSGNAGLLAGATTTKAAPGSYVIAVTATTTVGSTTMSHTSNVTLVVQ